jgi:Transposase DDE domain
LLNAIIGAGDLNLFAMNKNKREYDVYKGLVNGQQVNVLSSSTLISAVQKRSAELLQDSNSVYILHDPCDIRKPSAPKMEHIGKVLSLSKQVINGYKTFNSVAVDVTQQGVQLVSHSFYSTESPDYISQEQLKNPSDFTPAQAKLVADNEYINTSILFKKHIKESSQVVKKDNPKLKVCHILDREFDSESCFETVLQEGDDFIIRAKLSRCSHEQKQHHTPKTNLPSKKVLYHKLVDKSFKNKGEYSIDVLEIKGKKYRNACCVLEWEELILEKQSYQVVRITLFEGEKAIFEHPMLLITNKKVTNQQEAQAIYKGYLLRFKIEVVFKFLKQNLGWESFQVRDFESIKNLLAIGFFLIGYFQELEDELKKHPLALFLCQLANSKGKITLFFLLEGLRLLINFQEVQKWKQENNISDDNINEMINSLLNP